MVLEVPDDTWHCLADRQQLEGALLNLSLNARDAMFRGGEVVIAATNKVMQLADVATRGDMAVGDYVAIAVIDSGRGIDSEMIDRVFEPFFTTKRTGEGSGLRLSTVYGFAKQSGGHVEIDSELGAGTEVRLYLPRATPSRPRESPAAKEEPPLGAGETLLLVEDEAKLRELLTTLLKGLGYRVISAGDGAAALRILDEVQDVRMVLSDVMLVGGISGVELADLVREQRRDVKFLLMSGYSADALASSGHTSGDIDLLRKPFTRSAVARKVRAVLAGEP